MKKGINTYRQLESLKIFPYVAWGLIFLFAFLVYNTTLHLRIAATELQTQSEFTAKQAHIDPTIIKDFEKPKIKEKASLSQ